MKNQKLSVLPVVLLLSSCSSVPQRGPVHQFLDERLDVLAGHFNKANPPNRQLIVAPKVAGDLTNGVFPLHEPETLAQALVAMGFKVSLVPQGYYVRDRVR